MAREVCIIGGGIIGLFSAYYLRKSGHNVTIADQGDLTGGCSWGNAGMIVPSHFVPLAAPGMISKGVRWMFDSQSPFYVRPRLNSDLLMWGYHFYRNSSLQKMEQSIPALAAIGQLSRSLYKDLSTELPFDFGFAERGLLMLFKRKETGEDESETVEMAHRLGIKAVMLHQADVQKLEPDVKVDVKGGVFFQGDAHLSPSELTGKLTAHLETAGVRIIRNTRITSFATSGNRISEIVTATGSLKFDHFVLAAGAWSGDVARGLGLTLPMQAGKGYSFTLSNVKSNIRIPSILLEARVAITPMGTNLRFGGTMEIAGIDHRINMARVRGIAQAVPKYYPDLDISTPVERDVWHGLRPCSPDGLPYIGKSKKFTNLVLATGHAMMGVSLAPATGKIVAEVMDELTPAIGIVKFDPDRF